MVAIIGSEETMQLIVKGSIAQLAGKINTLSSTLVGVSKGNVDDKVQYHQCRGAEPVMMLGCCITMRSMMIKHIAYSSRRT